MPRKFTVVAVEGHTEVTTFGDLGPRFIEVIVRLANSMDETAEVRYPIAGHPRVGDIIEVPDFVLNAYGYNDESAP